MSTQPLQTFMVILINGNSVKVEADRFHISEESGYLKFWQGPDVIAMFGPFGWLSALPVNESP